MSGWLRVTPRSRRALAATMTLVGSALLAFSGAVRLMILGAVLIVTGWQLWHDTRVAERHAQEERRNVRYSDVWRAIANANTSRPDGDRDDRVIPLNGHYHGHNRR